MVAKKIVLEVIKEKDRTKFGRVFPGRVLEGQHAEIVPGESIVLYGHFPARTTYVKEADGTHTPVKGEPIPYRVEFKIGDEAEYGSYNMHYTGKIVGITAKTVTIQEEGCKAHRLEVAEFSWRNQDYDAEKIAARNHDVMMNC